MTAKPSSLEGAIRDAAGGEDMLGATASAEQLDLLRGADGKLPQNVFRLVREQARTAGPGRRAGSRNKRSDRLAKLVTQQHGCPVMAMASMYSRPLDQLIDLVLIADSTAEREERLLGLIERSEGMIDALMASIKAGGLVASDKLDERIDKVAGMMERVFDAAKALKMKPGDLAIKALNLQLAAARATAEYVHSKKPVEAVVNHKVDGVVVMPPVQPAANFEQTDAQIRMAADGIASMLSKGRIDPSQLVDLRFVDGQFTYDGDPVDPAASDADDDDADGGDDGEG
jgi:hypothetical protein